LFFDSFPGYAGGNPNKNPMCNKTARVTYKGKTIYVKLTDRCEGCAYGDLDFSPHAFNQIADPSEGRITGISWQLVD
jgi:expansin (peptidoglycan-binding protein)